VALEAIPKAQVYAAVIVSVGVYAARLLFLSRVHAPLDGNARSRVEIAFHRAAVWAVAALLLGLLCRAWAHTAVSFGFAESFSFANLGTIAWESQWGEAWQVQLVSAAALALLSWAIGYVPRVAWTLHALAAIAACYSLPLLGHAEGEAPRVLLHGSHVLGAGVWVGTLTVMALAAPVDVRDAMLRAFAPFAFAGASVVGASGVVAAWLYAQSPANLVTTNYGWVLVLKLFFVADVATFGFLNWRRFHRPDATAGSRREPSTTQDVFVYLETLLATAVVVITAVLTEIAHP
jgi:putative copper resistance protein D